MTSETAQTPYIMYVKNGETVFDTNEMSGLKRKAIFAATWVATVGIWSFGVSSIVALSALAVIKALQ